MKVPPSKSYTQRAIVVASLANSNSIIKDYLDCDDSKYLIENLKRLGIDFDIKKEQIIVNPSSQIGKKELKEPLYVGNAGTSARFLSSFSLISKSPIFLDGDSQIYRRPFPGLLNTLSLMGVKITYHNNQFCVPLTLIPPKDILEIPESIDLDASKSSQELSSLLMIAPKLKNGLIIKLTSSVPSLPYVDLTVDVMKEFGIQAIKPDSNTYIVKNTDYKGRQYTVEGDYSSASFIIAASWILKREIKIENLNPDSLQGDKVFIELLKLIPQHNETKEINMKDCPDLVPPLAVCAIMGNGTTIFTNIAHLRIKETDRISVLHDELKKVGTKVEEYNDKLIINSGKLIDGVELDPHNDHRMAMSFALLKLKYPNIKIQNRECVTKSFPNFWEIFNNINEGKI